MIINVYKPKDWTSFDVVAKTRGIFREKKVGHAGTLDPLAEGVLVVLTGNDTKKQEQFMKMKKEYVAEIAFGAVSPSYDMEFVPEFTGNTDITELQNILSVFTGKITQIVPPYSAKKIEGKEMYKLARKNIEIPVQYKEVEIFSCDVVNQEIREVDTSAGKKTLPCSTLKVECSSGTYIRSLAHELGEKLGTGAVLLNLVRTAVGPYRVEDAVKIEDLPSLQFR